MLQHLRIRNLALITEATLEFSAGFTAVTGETGAGKSILLGALNLLAGGRAEKTLIRAGADECEVEAILWLADPELVDGVLASLGLPPCEEGTLIISRTLARNKAPKVRINGQLATVGNLQVLGEQWIDFHGPGEPQKLLYENQQLSLLDSFARNESERGAYRAEYLAWLTCRESIEQLRQTAQLSPEETAFLESQIAAIDALDLSVERVEQLEADFRRLQNGQELGEKSRVVTEILQGSDGVMERLATALQLARELAALDPQNTGLADRLESLVIEAEDLGQEFEDLSGADEIDEETAVQIQSSMEEWMVLRRKYGGSLEAVQERREEMAARLSSQGDIEGSLAKLEVEKAELETRLQHHGEAVRETRVRAAHTLARDAAALLQHLGFKKARLEIEILRENVWREHGSSRCQFRFAPNPGVEPLSLGKIASSGEIARVMLALKAVLARVDATPVLVFDEVDANVGGEIAAVVGRELANLGSRGHQVFCITHLPQVAATASAHFVVEKEQGENRTHVSIASLGGVRDARVEELSRMLGDRHSASARKHAEELLLGA